MLCHIPLFLSPASTNFYPTITFFFLMARSVNVSRRLMPDNIHEPDEQVHVLAVDDSLVDRKVIERLLKITSCKVTAVDSGRRALQFLGLDHQAKNGSGSSTSIQVDLIITDYCMPGMTGFELLKIIKESSTFKEIPVVIMSSENVIARIDRCLEEGAKDFIVKPVKLSDVKRLRDYMTAKELNFKKQPINRRKTTGSSCHLSSLPQPLFLPSPSPCRFPSPSPRPMLSYSAPCSPTTPLDSPPRSLKLSSFD